VAGGGDGLVLVVSSGGYTHTQVVSMKSIHHSAYPARERDPHTHTHTDAHAEGVEE
jgi:hypothetical protein